MGDSGNDDENEDGGGGGGGGGGSGGGLGRCDDNNVSRDREYEMNCATVRFYPRPHYHQPRHHDQHHHPCHDGFRHPHQ